MRTKIITGFNFKLVLALILSLLLIWLLSEKLQTVAVLPTDESCIASFDAFAFTFPDVNGSTQDKILPLQPWQLVVTVPNVYEENNQGNYEIVAISGVDENTRVWLASTKSEQNENFLLYYPNRQEWKNIPSKIADRTTKVERIYNFDQQTVWGVSLEENPTMPLTNQLVISVFDDISNHFIVMFVQAVPQDWKINVRPQYSNISDLGESLIDSQGKLWVFSYKNAIYSLDFAKQQLQRHVSLEEYGTIRNLIYDPDGKFFFRNLEAQYQFTLTTNAIEEVFLPIDSYLGVSLVDHSGNLWLEDGYSWRAPDGDWHTLHPDPVRYWWHTSVRHDWVYYNLPDPFFESSNGRIWFRMDKSNNLNNIRSGLAWFNPDTQEGCWFTSEDNQIIEDSQQNLWMIINNDLYKYEYKS